MTDELIDELLAEIEEEKGLARITGTQVFKSALNQPSLIAVRSCDGEYEATSNGQYNSTAFNTFTLNLQRPCLDVDSVQLVAANIPQAQTNVPDTACAFWYYRTSEYSNNLPSINNLYYNRLLPSYYKPEFITNASGYGYNRTFKNYRDLSTELSYAGKTDLCFYNWSNWTDTAATGDFVPFIPNDVSLALDTAHNKFSMTGANVNTPPTFVSWLVGTTYALGNTVKNNGISYKSLQNGNAGHTPSSSPTWWQRDYNEIVADWDALTQYGLGRYVTNGVYLWKSTYPNATQNPAGDTTWTWNSNYTYTYAQVALDPSNNTLYTYNSTTPSRNQQPSSYGTWVQTLYYYGTTYGTGFICKWGGNYYVALRLSTGAQPDTHPNDWKLINFWTLVDTGTSSIWHRYLVAGYQDPNVIQAQGAEFEYSWNAVSLYEAGTTVSYNGSNYTAATQNRQVAQYANWTPSKQYSVGDHVRYTDGNNYIAISNNKNSIPRNPQTWASNQHYIPGDTVLYSGYLWTTNSTAFGRYPGQDLQPWIQISAYTAAWTRSFAPNTSTEPIQLWQGETAVLSGLTTIYSGTNYNIGDQVLYVGGATNAYYECIQTGNYNHTPSTSTTWWVPIRTVWTLETTALPLSSGLNYLSSLYDMVGTDGTNTITFPPQVPGQPFNPAPRRLLNTILGFTWNGVFSTAILPAFNTISTTIIPEFQDTIDAPVLNRFRPVPFYQVRPAWQANIVYPRLYVVVASNGLYYSSKRNNNLNHEPSASPYWWAVEATLRSVGDTLENSASTTGVYLADSFCNLVYSSLISIYTTIVGASSSDSARNTNLLAIVPLNCANLGVAFTNQFIDNPLTKISGDIFSIFIELRDEFDEPYYLSNNAVCSLMLKAKYESDIKPKETS